MRVLSLFSGVGGMDLGLERAGHEIVAMCEIDRHARGVLAYHWPNIPLHEDVTTLDGSQYRGSVDVVSGGSPCQDLSVAGRRKGLDGARSGLFWHQCRIADECAAPWFLWENVPGALSSNMGADFAAVLWGITGAYPRVPDGGWHNSGVIVGPKRWAVWRVLDAQYFGVPQRRRRVFVIGGPRTDMRPEILLESSGMFGDSAPQRAPGEEVAGTLGGGTPGGGPRTDTDRMTLIPDAVWGQSGFGKWTEGVTTIRATSCHRPEDNIVTFVKAKRAQSVEDDETWNTDRPAPSLNAFDNNSETRATVLAINENQRAEIVMTDIAHSITSGGGKPGQGYPAVLAPTLTAANDPSRSPQSSEITQQVEAVHSTGNGVRRLTPIECERLMGWPDNWTLHSVTGPQADSHRYRQTGNGVVANVTHWIGQRLHGAAS